MLNQKIWSMEREKMNDKRSKKKHFLFTGFCNRQSEMVKVFFSRGVYLSIFSIVAFLFVFVIKKVGAREGVEGYMVLTRRVAASPVTIVLYHDRVFLVHVYARVIFVSLVPGPCSS